MHEIEAHRVVLATRYPVLEPILPDEANNILKLDRFPADIMEVALSYAYTGRVRIDLGNVVGIFLLALNLQCSFMEERCIDFLRTRISRRNINEIWEVANSTLHKNLISICMSFIRAQFEDLANTQQFCISMVPECMAIVLADPHIKKRNLDELTDAEENERLKVRALSTWLDKQNPNESTEERAHRFESLLALLDLRAIPLDVVISLHATAAVLNVSKVYRDRISAALKQPRHVPGPPRRATFSFTHVRRSPAQENQVLVYGNTGESKCLLVDAPQIDTGPEVRHELPYRYGCSILRFRRWVCIIGGHKTPGYPLPSSTFDILSLDTGQLLKGPEMQEPRKNHSAVGTDKDIYVFGGENPEGLISSCEKYDPLSRRWSKLPDMPTARVDTSAVAIPDMGILVVGGRDFIWNYKNEAELLQIRDNQMQTWLNLPFMLSKRRSPGIAYYQGSVFVACGNAAGNRNDIEMMQMPSLSGSEPQWMLVSFMEYSPQRPVSLLVANDKLLLMNGKGDVLEFISPPYNEELAPSISKRRAAEKWKSLSKVDHVERPIFLG
ncbi:hypothetical protein Aperf_G00000050493 [Anoplocephala perfoliata]